MFLWGTSIICRSFRQQFVLRGKTTCVIFRIISGYWPIISKTSSSDYPISISVLSRWLTFCQLQGERSLGLVRPRNRTWTGYRVGVTRTHPRCRPATSLSGRRYSPSAYDHIRGPRKCQPFRQCRRPRGTPSQRGRSRNGTVPGRASTLAALQIRAVPTSHLGGIGLDLLAFP